MGRIFQRIKRLLGMGDDELAQNQEGQVWKVGDRGKPEQVVVFYPRDFGETEKISQKLVSGQPVIVNLENLPYDQAQRMIDYLSGTVYCLDGRLQKAGEYIFLFTPPGVDIDADELMLGRPDWESPFL